MNRILSRLSLTAMAIVAGTALYAQGTQTANIVGKVVDSNGAALSGVKIIVSSPSLQQQRTVISTADGSFRIPLLPPGAYRLVFTKEGLNTVSLTPHMGLGQDFSPKVVMAPAAEATVVISATSVAADKTDFKTSTNFEKDTVDALPINRGNALDLAYLTPGVQPDLGGNAATGEVTIRGAQGTGNLVMVDGQNVMDNLYVGQRIAINFDSVQETQVLTGAIPAEYGNIEGGVINQITKIGGNDFSGDIRWDMQNNEWNAAAPMQDRGSIDNNLLESRSVSVGGPILKDRIWFYASYFDRHPNHSFDFTGDAHLPDTPYFNSSENDYRHEVKLTFAPTVNQSITASYNKSTDAYLRNVAGTGQIEGLTPFTTAGEFGGISWSSILNDSMTLFLRGGYKKQTFGSNPSAHPLPGLLYNYADGFTSYGSPVFDPNDPQPDDRRNYTMNGKLSWFFDKAGSHQLDLGFDWYQGTTKASGYQTPGRISIPSVSSAPLNLWYALATDYNPSTTQSVTSVGVDPGLILGPQQGVWDPAYMQLAVMEYVPDQLIVKTTGLFANDKWTLNQHWLFNIGVRYDEYTATNHSHGKISSNHAFSPRLGAKYDLFGDNQWVFGLAWNRYEGRPLETIFANAGYSNNAIQYYFNANAASPAAGTVLNGADFFNPKYYDVSLAPGSFAYTNAALNVRVDPSLKQQQVDETTGSVTWNFKAATLGKGFLRATGTYKKWNNLVDATTGTHGQVHDPVTGGNFDTIYWTNDPLATRTYRDLELDGALNATNGWSLTGNFTWANLEGNYNGEGKSSPGNGTTTSGLQGTQYAATEGSTVNYNPLALNPSGKLDGGLTVNLLASKSYENAYGKMTLGLVYYHKSTSGYYSLSRAVQLNSQFPGTASNTNITNSTTYNQYFGGVGAYAFPSTSDTSLSAQQDFNVAKVGSHSVTAFLKVAIDNVFNHQQIAFWNTTINQASTAAAPISYGNHFGQLTGAGNFASPRSYVLSAGLKF